MTKNRASATRIRRANIGLTCGVAQPEVASARNRANFRRWAVRVKAVSMRMVRLLHGRIGGLRRLVCCLVAINDHFGRGPANCGLFLAMA